MDFDSSVAKSIEKNEVVSLGTADRVTNGGRRCNLGLN